MKTNDEMAGIRNLAEKKESETLEFKEKFDKEAIQSAAAFANSKGGLVLIGVGNKGEVKGVEIGKETLKDWANEICQSTEPTVVPVIEAVEIKGKTIVAVSVKESPIKPIACKGICYSRIGNSNKKLSPKEIAELHLQTIGSSWDSRLSDAKLEDIDFESVRKYTELAGQTGRKSIRETPQEALEKLDLVKGNKATWAAVLLFGKYPQRFVFQAKVHCGRFKDEITIIDDAVMDGTIIEQVNKTLEFIKKHLKLKFEIVGEARRKEEWEYPLEAVREAVINAVCHRDYTEHSDIQVRIYDDKLIVWNPGKLPLGITLDSLYKTHKSVLRNSMIAEVFFDIAFIERWGTGIQRIIELCGKQNLPVPVFEEYQGFRVTFRKPFAREELEKLGLNERQLMSVDYAQKRGSITNKEYRKLNSATKRTATRDLTDLVQKGIFGIAGKGKRKLRYILVLRQNVPKMSQEMSQNQSKRVTQNEA